MSESREFRAGPDDAGRRLDRVLRSLLPELPLSALYGMLRRGRIRLNGRKAGPESRLAEGDLIGVAASLLPAASGPASPAQAEASALDEAAELGILEPYLVYASADLLFLNKPRGLPSHGPGGLDGLVARALAARSSASLSFSPGPLHRLDRNSSGLITFPRSAAGARAFTALLRSGGLRKRYLALLGGELGGREEWLDLLRRDRARELTEVFQPGGAGAPPPGFAQARSRATPLLAGGGLCLALVEIETGLTHQIRAQAASRGLALAGDGKYGGGALPGGYLLHAWLLDLLERPFPDLPARLEAPLPAEARAALEARFGPRELGEALEAARDSDAERPGEGNRRLLP